MHGNSTGVLFRRRVEIQAGSAFGTGSCSKDEEEESHGLNFASRCTEDMLSSLRSGTVKEAFLCLKNDLRKPLCSFLFS